MRYHWNTLQSLLYLDTEINVMVMCNTTTEVLHVQKFPFKPKKIPQDQGNENHVNRDKFSYLVYFYIVDKK